VAQFIKSNICLYNYTLFTALILVTLDPVSKWGKSEKNTNKAKKKEKKRKKSLL